MSFHFKCSRKQRIEIDKEVDQILGPLPLSIAS